jgi:hypothetical protein
MTEKHSGVPVYHTMTTTLLQRRNKAFFFVDFGVALIAYFPNQEVWIAVVSLTLLLESCSFR